MPEYNDTQSGGGLNNVISKDEFIKCPRCNSKRVKKNGPFSKKYKDGKIVPPEPAKYHCWDCDYNWEN